MCKPYYNLYATYSHKEILWIDYCNSSPNPPKPKCPNSFSNTDREGKCPRCYEVRLKKAKEENLGRTRKWAEGENAGEVNDDFPHYIAKIGNALQLQIATEVGVERKREESIEKGYQRQRRKRLL